MQVVAGNGCVCREHNPIWLPARENATFLYVRKRSAPKVPGSVVFVELLAVKVKKTEAICFQTFKTYR